MNSNEGMPSEDEVKQDEEDISSESIEESQEELAKTNEIITDNPELMKWISEARKGGLDRQEIFDALKDSNYEESDIDMFMNTALDGAYETSQENTESGDLENEGEQSMESMKQKVEAVDVALETRIEELSEATDELETTVETIEKSELTKDEVWERWGEKVNGLVGKYNDTIEKITKVSLASSGVVVAASLVGVAVTLPTSVALAGALTAGGVLTATAIGGLGMAKAGLEKMRKATALKMARDERDEAFSSTT